MANTTFSGPIRIQPTKDSTAVGVLTAAQVVPITVTAVASTALTVQLPKCRVLRIATITDVAFTGATVTLAVGSAAAGAQYVAAVDIKPLGFVNHALVGAGLAALKAVAEGTTLFITVAQTTPTAVGAATVVIEYIPLA